MKRDINDSILLVGIDYSINSPAMSIYCGNLEKNDFKIKNLDFYSYINSKKLKQYGENKYINYNLYDWNNSINRFENIAIHFVNKILSFLPLDDIYIAIEGYSYGSNRSLIFNIAENTAILKYLLYLNNLKYKIYQPKSVKRFIGGEGKGNAKKGVTCDCLCRKLNIDLSKYLGIEKKEKNTLLYDFSDSLSILYMLYCEMLIKKKTDNNILTKEIIDFFTLKGDKGYSIIDEGFV